MLVVKATFEWRNVVAIALALVAAGLGWTWMWWAALGLMAPDAAVEWWEFVRRLRAGRR